jgi:hypothetical protein
MALDHARHEGRARQVDDLCAGGRGEIEAGSGDPGAVDKDAPAIVHGDTIKHPGGAEEERVCQRRSGEEEGGYG